MRKSKIPRLDLHGQTEDKVFDLLDQFIRKHQKHEQLMLIVGKGKGIVKKKAIEYLKMTHYPWQYEKIRGITNEGALIIDLY